ncbi:hypothetical protein N7478_000419 [Penicillium angulare]|uniref:uncharacterized protein n=1 Tax=Penicillium angulare TaxID=116970 RepID=UPI00253F8CBE|nr:uncharacterized protein N7478_000419 [Penicillium angulare]KAJ5291168.1 hypothetical protein N7478_000419 [Penicillium angulare]
MDAMDVDSDDYEYEYDETETESFYINLDLTSANGPIRPPRQRNGDTIQEEQTIEDPSQDGPDENPDGENFAPLESTETDAPSERIQVLGLHTCNPIVSYYNHIFSCSWADQIGTELVFTHPDTIPDPDHTVLTPLREGPAFELLAANSVKIMGRKATIVSSSNPGLVSDNANDLNSISTDTTPVPSQGPTSGRVAGRPEPATHQANFINRLQSLKNAKGQSDTVRRSVNTRRGVNYTDRLAAWARTEAQMAHVSELSRRAASGDEAALALLEKMIRDYDKSEGTQSAS